jgi:hypothetical protein
MKAFARLAVPPLLLVLLLQTGCTLGPPDTRPPDDEAQADPVAAYLAYAAAKVHIIPLTGFATDSAAERPTQIRAYVSLLDEFDCQIKSPAVFRFELFKALERSPEPRGKRVIIWPDTDLTEPTENNTYWRDYLRAYEFNLDFQPAADQNYLLQVTCLCPAGRRLSADFRLRSPE